MTGPHQPILPRPLRQRMSLLMTRPAQANEVLKPVRVRPTPTRNVMHIRHRSHATELTHPVAPLPHLLPALRVHSVTLPTLIAHSLHGRISSCTARSNSAKSNWMKSETSRIESNVPPARSHPTNASTTSGGQGTRCCEPHTAHRHTSRHGRRSNRVRLIGTGTSEPQPLHTPLWATRSGSASASEFNFGPVSGDDRL